MTDASTTSRPLFNRQQLISLFLPLVAEQALSISIGLADTLMVSSVGEAAVSGVSLVDSFNVLMIQLLSALATGGAVVASQYMGRRDQESAQRSAAQLYSVLAISTVAVGVLCLALSRPILRGVFGSIDDEVMHYAQQYFIISAISYPFIGLYNGGAALFRAQGNSRISMLASLVMNVINIGGNALLIYGFGMGVVGAALATLIGRVFAAVWILWQNQNIHNPLRVAGFADLRPRKEPIMKVLAIGVPSGLENGMFQIGKLCVSSLTSTLGTSAIAANAVANNLDAIGCIVGNAMGLAMITVIGRCIGAQDFEQTKYYTKKLLLWDYIAQGAVNVVVLLSLNQILSMYTLAPETRALAWTLVMIHNGMSIFLWPASFVLPNALRAANDVRFTMVVATASMLVWRMGLSWVLCVQMGMGAVGVWYAMVVDWICRIICFVARFVSGAWKKNAMKKAA